MAHRRPNNAAELLRQAERLMASPAYREVSSPDRQKVQQTVRKIYETVYGTADVKESAPLGPGSAGE